MRSNRVTIFKRTPDGQYIPFSLQDTAAYMLIDDELWWGEIPSPEQEAAMQWDERFNQRYGEVNDEQAKAEN